MPINRKCQVFTPKINVIQLLDAVGYSKNLYGKKVAENSCGDGNILVEIVERYIQDGLRNKLSIASIRIGLEEDIWAVEIDTSHITTCKSNLDAVAHKYNIQNVTWNIIEGDFLKQEIEDQFDFIISNPPYITYRDLPNDAREFVRENFTTCAVGKFDYCYAFIEGSIKALKHSGTMTYLIPSNIFKNQFGLGLRKYMLPHITDIYDFTSQKLFSKKLTTSAIIVCNKCSNTPQIRYHNLSAGTKFNLSKAHLGDKWIFKQSTQTTDKQIRFGDHFHAASSIATLLNEAYIISDFTDMGDYIDVKGQKVEKLILRDAVSPRSLSLQKKEYVVFPYSYDDNGKLLRLSVHEFEEQSPGAVKYLQRFQEKLKMRTSERGNSWFEYGRSQALAHLNQEKLLLSTLVTGKVKVSKWDNLTIPTSGIYIIMNKAQQQYTLIQAQAILNSDLFLEYIQGIGIISGGNSFRITSKDINNFLFSVSLLKL